jgi:hypothetical protein
MLLAAARITVAAFLFVTPTVASSDGQAFALGHVDLLGLAESVPLEPLPAPTSGEPSPRTLRDLYARVEAFLAGDVRREVEGARWRLAWAEGRAANVASGSYENNWPGALLATVVGMIGYSTDSGLREAKACLSFLESYQRRVRTLRDGVPETDELAPPGLLDRWQRLTVELRANTSCRRRR